MNVTPVQFADLSEEVLKQGNRLRFRVKGYSMYPAILDGDVLEIEPLAAGRVRKGDIVFYRSPRGMMVAHRAVRVFDSAGAQRVIVKGDANTGEAEDIATQEILGRVTALERRGRTIRVDSGWRRYPVCGPLLARALLRLQRPGIGRSVKRRGRVRDEDLLVRSLAQPVIDPAAQERIRSLLSPELDWAYFFETLQVHCVASIAYRNLCVFDEAKAAVPEEILGRMKSCYYRNASRNAFLCSKLQEIATAFQASGIDVCLLKGIALIHTVYSDIGLRPMADMDLLVRREDRLKAHAVLSSFGYRCVKGGVDQLESQKSTYVNSVIYEAPAGEPFFIHLHWHLVNSSWPVMAWVRAMDMEMVWRRAEVLALGSAPVFVLAPSHQVIHLCQHAFMHSVNRLVLVSDIFAVMDAYQDRLDSRLLFEEARSLRCDAVLAYFFTFMARIFGSDPRPPQAPWPAPASTAEKLLLRFGRQGRRGFLISYLGCLFLEEGVLNKLRFLFRTLFPSRLVLGHHFFLSPSQIRLSHTVRRLREHF